MTLKIPPIKHTVYPEELVCFYVMNKIAEGKMYVNVNEAAQLIPFIRYAKDTQGNKVGLVVDCDFRWMAGGQAYSHALYKVFNYFRDEQMIVRLDKGCHITGKGVQRCKALVVHYRTEQPKTADRLVTLIRDAMNDFKAPPPRETFTQQYVRRWKSLLSKICSA